MIDKYAEEEIKVRPKETRQSVAERVGKIDIVYYSAIHPYSTYLTQVGFSAEGGSSSHQLADGIYTTRQVASLFGKSQKRPAQLFHGQQVIVCAAIRGVQYQMEIDYACCACCRIPDDTSLGPEFGDSAITPDREWAIFFDPDHLLPLYILHLETADGEENPRMRWEDLPEEEKKEFLTAHAKKHFPFGFGKAGSKFVVEDKAQSRDDEE
ncbi:hypothetical protein FRB90_006220 [Tulasnella sp. 427]|nr:hypothetical protein FRB90_006220 [Tulasnella sp. 427]